MMRCWPMRAQRCEMLRRAIAGVTLPSEMRMGQGIFAHHAVAVFLGKDRCSRDARLQRIAAHDGPRVPAPVRMAAVRSKISVDQDFGRLPLQLLAQRADRQSHRQHRCAEDIEPINIGNIDDAHCPAASPLYDRFKLSTALARKLFRVIQA